MKQSRCGTRSIAVIACTAALLAPCAHAVAQSSAPAMPFQHRCGGVGADALRSLKGQAADYNLGFWLVAGPHGDYLADVPIEIKSHGNVVASFTADGPLCYVRVPRGTYTVTGVYDGRSRSIELKSGSMDGYLRW